MNVLRNRHSYCLFAAFSIGVAAGFKLRDYCIADKKRKMPDPIVLLPKKMERKARRAIRNVKDTLDDWS